MKVNKRGLADCLGVTEETITQWMKAGCPVESKARGSKGNVYVSGDVHHWRVAKAEQKVSEPGDLNDERARLTKAQADKAELEVAELRGELVRVEDVTAAWGQHIATARSRLLAMPTRVAPRISPPGMVVQTEGMIRAIVEESLNELAGDGLPERTRSRISRAAGVEGPGEADGERVGGPAPSPEPRKQRRARKVGHREG